MPKKKTSNSHNKSWRSIRQSSKHRAVSEEALQRKRRWFVKGLAAFLGVGVLAALSAWCIHISNTNPEMLRIGKSDQSVKHIYFSTDGVLTQTWVEREFMPYTDGVPLSDVDINKLDSFLEGKGQIREATVRRVYPDGLSVMINEHRPVMRIRVAGSDGRPATMLVADTGHVYEARGYAEAALERLPHVGGVSLRREGEGYAPINGVAVVSELLESAVHFAPELYSRWRVVMLDDFDGRTDVAWANIKVRTEGMGEIVFNLNDFDRQIARLVSIVDAMNPIQRRDVRRIDLTLEDRAAVRVVSTPSSPYHKR